MYCGSKDNKLDGPTFIEYFDLELGTPETMVKVLYFISSTFTATGIGEFYPVTEIERIGAILLLFGSFIVPSVIYSVLSQIKTQMDQDLND